MSVRPVTHAVILNTAQKQRTVRVGGGGDGDNSLADGLSLVVKLSTFVCFHCSQFQAFQLCSDAS